MNPEVNKIHEAEIKHLTPEELKKLQKSVVEKIKKWEQDAYFSDDEKKDLSDLNDDKILSEWEKNIEENLKRLDSLTQQIDFLLSIVELKAERNIAEIAKNTAEKSFKKIEELRQNFVWNSENNENIASNEDFIEKENDSEEIKKLKKLWINSEKENDKESIDSIKKILAEINNLEKSVNKPYSNSKDWEKITYKEGHAYVKQKYENINKIIDWIKEKGKADSSDLFSIKLEKYDIDWTIWANIDSDGKRLFEIDLNKKENLDNLALEEAVALLNYTNRNFTEIDDKWSRAGNGSLAWLDSEVEILNMQKILLEEISKKAWKDYILIPKSEWEWTWRLSIKLLKRKDSNVDYSKNTNSSEYEWLASKITAAMSFGAINPELISDFSKEFNNIAKERDEKMKEGVSKIKEGVKEQNKDILNNFRNVNEQKPSYIDLKLFQWAYMILTEKDFAEVEKKFEVLSNLKWNEVRLDIVNATILNNILKNEKIKVNFESIKNINLKELFLERVDLNLLFRKLDKSQKETFLEKTNQLLLMREEKYSKNNQLVNNLLSIKQDADVDTIVKEKNLNWIKNIIDPNYKEEIRQTNKNFDELTKWWLNKETIQANQEVTVDYIAKNINRWQVQNATQCFKFAVDLIKEWKFDSSLAEKLIKWPKNLEVVKILFASKSELKYDLKDFVSDVPEKIWRLDWKWKEYIDFMINESEIDFRKPENKITDFFDIYREIDVTLYILEQLKNKYNISWNILDWKDWKNWLLEPSEIWKIYVLWIKNLEHTKLDKLNASQQEILMEFTNSFDKITLIEEVKWIKSDLKSKLSNLSDSQKDNLREKWKWEIKDKFWVNEQQAKEIFDILEKSEENDVNMDDQVRSILKITGSKWNEKEKILIISKIIKNYNLESLEKETKKQEENKVELWSLWVDKKDMEEFSLIEDKLKENIKNWEKLSPEEKEKIIQETQRNFLENKYWNNPKKKEIFALFGEINKWNKKIAKIQNKIDEAEIRIQNTDAYVDFIRSWQKWSFEQYAKENKIPLYKDWKIINAKEIWVNEIAQNWVFRDGLFIANSWIVVDTNKWMMKDKAGNEIKLSQQEKNMMKSNPEIAKNIVNLYDSLEKVWLSKLWNLRENIFKSVENTFGLQFDRKDWDFLDEREIKIFFNAILSSIWEKPMKPDLKLNIFLNEIEKINWREITWKERQINSYWETRLESVFINKFMQKWDAFGFKQEAFERALKEWSKNEKNYS